ncbi:MAG: hypothetical protein J5I98_31740 [Phaeodactylibacter sp.]|nr:hypothetical protein [Phaeodactylibacter sp.]
MSTTNSVYIKALSNGEWFGGWAPVDARLEWMRPDGQVGLFTLVEEGLDEDDEYEYFQQGSLVVAVRDGEDYKVQGGVDADVLSASSSQLI